MEFAKPSVPRAVLPVEVLFWRLDPGGWIPNFASSFGHATLRVGDQYHDQGPNGWRVIPVQGAPTKFVGLYVQLEMQEHEARRLADAVDQVRRRQEGAYNPLTNNCAQAIAESFRVAGYFMGPILTPLDLRARFLRLPMPPRARFVRRISPAGACAS